MTYSEFSKLADVLNESVLADKRYGQALNKCVSFGTFFSFWENIVGKRFVKISIPYNLKGTTHLVSVVNSVVVQEMSLYKADILKKMEPYAKGLNFTINDIRFDYKNWLSIKNEFNKESSKAFDIDAPEYYTDKDFEKICIDNDEELELQKVRENLLKNESLPAETKERIYNNILKSIKAQKLRKNEQK